jgi:predicted Zn finger-like uncharacterized protein
MSLVTRCTACGTLFKVVADQLKISDGWVRCGQCAHVFDAQANLVQQNAVADNRAQAFKPDIPSEVQSGASNFIPHQPPVFKPRDRLEAAAVPSWDESSLPPESMSHDSDFLAAYVNSGLKSSTIKGELALLEAAQAHRTSAEQQPESLGSEQPDSRQFKPGALRDTAELDSEMGVSTTSWAQSGVDSHLGERASRSAEPTTLNSFAASSPEKEQRPNGQFTTDMQGLGAQAQPSFIAQAQRDARWRSPWMRLGLSMVALVLLAVLAAQVALQEKDHIAARYPQAQPWLTQMCEYANCRVQPFKRIESIVIDSSSFNRINKNNPQLEASMQSYNLGVTLKNTGNLPIALPHVELSLQDTQDQTIVRRVLSPADLGSSLERLMPAQEMVGRLTLQIPSTQLAGSRINGYRVLAFYP